MSANKTVKQIHDLLIAQVTNLSAAISSTTDAGKAKQLLLEMQEVEHRVDVAQNLMFANTSKTLESYLPNIVAANSELTRSINQIGDVAKILNGAVELLKVVDQALDLAKTFLVA